MLFAFKNDVLPEVETLISDEEIVIFDDVDLRRHFLSDFSGEGVDSIFIGIGIDEESNLLGDG